MNSKSFGRSFFLSLLLIVVSGWLMPAFAQTEMTEQGSITGLRIAGGIVPFETSIRFVDMGWTAVYATNKEGQFSTEYMRNGKKQTVASSGYGVRFLQSVTDTNTGENKVQLILYADSTRTMEGAFFCIKLPADRYANGTVRIGETLVSLTNLPVLTPQKTERYTAKLIQISGNESNLELEFRGRVTSFVCKEASGDITVYISMADGKQLMKNNSLQLNFTMHATGGDALIAAQPTEKATEPAQTTKPAETTVSKPVEAPAEVAADRTAPTRRTDRASGYAIAATSNSNAQTEVMAWGNITGIRVNGELMAFETSLRLADPGWNTIHSTGKEKQSYPQYTRNGQQQTVVTSIKKARFEQVVTEEGAGRSNVSITVRADTTMAMEGVFYCLELPADRYANGLVNISGAKVELATMNNTDMEKAPRHWGNRIQVDGAGRSLKLEFRTSVAAFVQKEPSGNAIIYIALMPNKTFRKGSTFKNQFSIQATGDIDNERVEVVVDRTQPGRQFDGLGGNFRLQNARLDPKVIDYCLNNMRVGWGRVEMPWRYWQTEENTNPIDDARSGKIDDRVTNAMKMAQRLKAEGMPVIVSAWFPPVWAIDGDPAKYVSQGGVQAYRLDPRKKEKIYKSITDYLVYLKQAFGVEASMFSFNESDLGIDVLFTPREHATFIKELGAYMASRGLATKLLLGDNSDATTFDFILPAMEDKDTYPYIGAVSFHSWRGCDDATMHKWAEASRRLNVPLIVGEGSTDAAAWRYPQIFAESTFALYEINLYTRICAICQPQSILQWQLTSDYSILLGDGIFGTDGLLRRTQRYWNLKQLATTPEQSFALPFTSTKDQVNCAAFGNIARGEYAVHMVNNGAARPAVVKGLPEKTADVKVYVTTSDKGMEELKNVVLSRGTVTFELPAASFATVIAMP